MSTEASRRRAKARDALIEALHLLTHPCDDAQALAVTFCAVVHLSAIDGAAERAQQMVKQVSARLAGEGGGP